MDSTPTRRRTSILRRIMLMSWLVAVMSVVVFALFMVRYQRDSIHRELQARASNLATGIEDEIGSAIVMGRRSLVVVHCLKVLAKNSDVNFIVIAWPDGDSLVHYNPGQYRREKLGDFWSKDRHDSGEATLMEPDLPGVEKRASLHWRQRCSSEGIPSGFIHIGMSLEAYHQNVFGVYLTTAIVGTLTLIIGGAAAWVFARNLTRPIHSLQAFAYKVATGSLNARATVDSKDEIGELADSFNRMVEALESSQTRLRDSVKTEAAAREKEILLREIHHRVKNNMQILTSLLRLQTRRANSEELRMVLQESESRIRSMGLLHEKLYQSESVSSIDMGSYLKTLTNELLRVNTPQGKRREIKISVRDIYLGMDTALPCGLIVTELVSNALKYAFPDYPDGIIYVSVSKEQDGEFNLIVWDNGIGIPDTFDISRSQSLGMRLVTMLVDQLNGKVSFSGHQGTRWEIKFRETAYKIRL
jgi:two-component sensor histidine kinase